MVHLLLLSKLTERVAAYGVMALRHAQGAAALAGHTGETLAPGEVVHGHLVKTHILPPQLLLPLQDGCGCEGSTESFINPETACLGPSFLVLHLGSQLGSKGTHCTSRPSGFSNPKHTAGRALERQLVLTTASRLTSSNR